MADAAVRLVLLFVISALLQGQSHAIAVTAILGAISTAKEVASNLMDIWNLIADGGGSWFPFLGPSENTVHKRLDKINSKMDDLTAKIENLGSMITILQQLPERLRLELRLNDLLDHMTVLDVNYRRMQKYTKNLKSMEKQTLKSFARHVVSHGASSTINLLERMHTLVVPQGEGIDDPSLLRLLANAAEDPRGEMMCGFRQSPQQIMFSLYGAIALTELKGYTMIQFAYIILKYYGKGKFKKEVQLSKERHEERMKNVRESFKNAMQTISRSFWMCDPDRHKGGKTFTRITYLVQGYIQNEQEIEKGRSCFSECPKYTKTKSYSKKEQTCEGEIRDCQFIGLSMKICTSDSEIRRYGYIDASDGNLYGNKEQTCKKISKSEYYSWVLFYRCDYCFCLCEHMGRMSHRHFNMRPVISDIENNKVVTGLRFYKHHGVIHLRIQQAKLLPKLKINASAITWKRVEKYDIYLDSNVTWRDYHTLTWDDRKINLDDLEADEGHVLTGVRFINADSHLSLGIHTTKFNVDTGKLEPAKSKWKHRVGVSRSEVTLSSPDVPTKSTSPSIPTSQSDQYIEFTHSDINKDAAQTTVPFLDTQRVRSREAVPLVGAGIFHKGQYGYGGFIALKVITFDLSNYLKPQPKQVKSKKH